MCTECTDQGVVLTGAEERPIEVRYEDIARCSVVRRHPTAAWLFIPAFPQTHRLFSLGGRDWVLIEMRSGDSIQVGSRRASELAEVICRALAPSSGSPAALPEM